ncbi:MAG TPA: sensor histidine kinase, partial [Fluviicola sp.]|nr:sensor histidine kinase [Fluviicola sp.]
MVEQCYEWAEYHERIKYNLVRNILYAFSIVMLMLGIFNLTSNKMDGLPNLFAAAVCISGIILLHKSNNYKLVALFISATSLIIVGIAFFLSNGSNLLTPYWMLVNVIFSFYMIGKIFGSFILVIHFITYFIFQKYFYDTNVVLFSSFKTIDYVTYLLEFSAIGFSIIYLLVIFSKAASLSEKDFKKINNHLTKQNVVISKQYTEMELMLKEIHHRVKNNMQIISSLLRLEANRATEKSGAFYQEAIDRISAMALVHEKMYKTGALSKFDLEKYIESLVSN